MQLKSDTMNFMDYFLEHWHIILGLIIAYFSFILPIYKYLQDKRKEERDKRFKNYHELIDELIGGQPNRQVMLDRQIAIIYELRNFKGYFPVTLRILTGLRNTTWRNADQRLLDEIELTEKYIGSSRLTRMFKFRDR